MRKDEGKENEKVDEQSKDILDVMKLEKSRGRKAGAQLDIRERELRAKLRGHLQVTLRNRDRRGFMEAIRACGYQDGTSEFLGLVELFDQIAGQISQEPY